MDRGQDSERLSVTNPMTMDETGNISGYLYYNDRDYEFHELPPKTQEIMLEQMHFWLVFNSASTAAAAYPELGKKLIDYALLHPANS